MNLVQWICFVLVFCCSYGDTGDIPTNGTLDASNTGDIPTNGTLDASNSGDIPTNETLDASTSPCSAVRNFSSSVLHGQFNGFCYWISNYSHDSFLISDQRCSERDGKLASIHSLEELNFMRQLVQGKGDLFWVGLLKPRHDTYLWKDSTPVDFVNWEDGYSGDRRNPFFICVAVNPTNGYFIHTACYRKLLYICKAREELDVQTTVTSAPSNTTVALPEVCPDGWITFGDKCYAALGLELQERETWAGANQKCLDMGATMVSIHSRDEQDFLYLSIIGKTDMAWIGLHEVPSNTDRAFHWSDSSPVDFVYWDENQPNNWNNYKEECGNMRSDSPHYGRWNDAECKLKQSYICQTHIDPKKARFAQDIDVCTVPKGWIKLGSSCYNIFTGTGNNMKWMEAQYFCRDFGGNIVTIRNLKDLTFLRFHLADVEGEFWIGLRNERSNATYAWITERARFTNWDRGQPYEFSDEPNCVATKPNGRWVVRSCNENHPFICEVDEGAVTPVPEEPTEGMRCPNNSMKWRDYGTSVCYIIELQNRVPWYQAAHLCFQEGGFLAIFHSIEEVNAVINQIKDYKDPLYIGLGQTYDGDFAWVDRSVLDFANWLPGQPSSTTQMCVEMLSASGKWNDISCEIQKGYICTVPKVFYNESLVMAPTRKIPDSGGISTIGTGGILGIVLFFLISVIISVAAYCCLYPSRRSVRSTSQSELCDEDI